MLMTGQIWRGRFKIGEQYQEGGMGTVFQAVDQWLQRPVVIKRNLFHQQSLMEKFEREARLLGKLRHPGLPFLVDYLKDETGQYLVMEFIDGDSLQKTLQRTGGPLSVEETIRLGLQLLEIVEFLHAQTPAIVHRDIKPSNLKIQKGSLVLLDFGLAKPAGAGDTTTLSHASEGYAAPEQYQKPDNYNEDFLPRIDLYAIGATLYRFLIGYHQRTPQGKDYLLDARVRESISQSSPERIDPLLPVHQVNSAVPLNLSAFISRAMAIDPANRFETARRMRLDLQALAEPLAPSLAPTQPVASRSSEKTIPVPPPRPEVPGPESSGPVFRQSPPRPFWIVPATAVAMLTVGLGLGGWLFRGESVKPDPVKDSTTPAPLTGTPGPANSPPAPPGMVFVPGGTFRMGNDSATDPADKPAHSVKVDSFFIDETEVTNGDFEAFAKKRNLDWKPVGAANLPATNVTWEEAQGYAKSVGKRLPTEAEWEFAARGTDGRLYPWGNSFQSTFCNSQEAGLKTAIPVRDRAEGKSPFGCLQMAGNVAEWTLDAFKPYPGSQAPSKANVKVLRGGSYSRPANSVIATRRGVAPPDTRSEEVGFRCVKEKK